MGVRVKLKIHCIFTNEVVEAIALANTGYEAEDPQLLIPLELAKKLKLYPLSIKGEAIAIRTASGEVTWIKFPNSLKVSLLLNEKALNPIMASAVISDYEVEVLINDKALEELGIIIESPWKGLWRLKGEEKIRESFKPEYWVRK